MGNFSGDFFTKKIVEIETDASQKGMTGSQKTLLFDKQDNRDISRLYTFTK
jgi:hypothetical protein